MIESELADQRATPISSQQGASFAYLTWFMLKIIFEQSYEDLPDPTIDNHRQRLPDHLHMPDTFEIPVLLRDEDQHLTRALRW